MNIHVVEPRETTVSEIKRAICLFFQKVVPKPELESLSSLTEQERYDNFAVGLGFQDFETFQQSLAGMDTESIHAMIRHKVALLITHFASHIDEPEWITQCLYSCFPKPAISVNTELKSMVKRWDNAFATEQLSEVYAWHLRYLSDYSPQDVIRDLIQVKSNAAVFERLDYFVHHLTKTVTLPQLIMMYEGGLLDDINLAFDLVVSANNQQAGLYLIEKLNCPIPHDTVIHIMDNGMGDLLNRAIDLGLIIPDQALFRCSKPEQCIPLTRIADNASIHTMFKSSIQHCKAYSMVWLLEKYDFLTIPSDMFPEIKKGKYFVHYCGAFHALLRACLELPHRVEGGHFSTFTSLLNRQHYFWISNITIQRSISLMLNDQLCPGFPLQIDVMPDFIKDLIQLKDQKVIAQLVAFLSKANLPQHLLLVADALNPDGLAIDNPSGTDFLSKVSSEDEIAAMNKMDATVISRISYGLESLNIEIQDKNSKARDALNDFLNAMSKNTIVPVATGKIFQTCWPMVAGDENVTLAHRDPSSLGAICGDIGSGKSTLVVHLLNQLAAQNIPAIYLSNDNIEYSAAGYTFSYFAKIEVENTDKALKQLEKLSPEDSPFVILDTGYISTEGIRTFHQMLLKYGCKGLIVSQDPMPVFECYWSETHQIDYVFIGEQSESQWNSIHSQYPEIFAQLRSSTKEKYEFVLHSKAQNHFASIKCSPVPEESCADK